MYARRLWEPAKTFFSVIGVTTFTAGGVAIYSLRETKDSRKSLPDNFIIELDLEGCKLVEKKAPSLLATLQRGEGTGSQELELQQAVRALHAAARDPRVSGLLLNIGGNQKFQGLAQVEELRNAILDFRRSSYGRAFTVAHGVSFGEGGAFGTLPYYFASSCDKVFMQPSGLLSISGIATETWFLRGLLDKWNIKPQWFARERYKNVISPYIERGHTKEHAEATKCLLHSWLGHVTTGLASARGLSHTEVQSAVNAAPLTCEQAVSRGLIDGALYKDEVLEAVGSASTDEGIERVTLQQYIEEQDRHRTSMLADVTRFLKEVDSNSDPQELQKIVLPQLKPAVALITATGQIICGKSLPHKRNVIASSALCKDIAAARDDPAVKALVLRIDSPGGSAIASDSIYREIKRTREAGKPVVVSMGNMAASGGYYIAAPASLIVAQPCTITGSIGVVFGKFNLAGFLRGQGINPEALSAGPNANAMSWFNDFTGAQKRQVNAIVDHVYDNFIEKVAEARSMSVSAVRKIAKGRMWTGQDALALGLVDRLGGLEDAIRCAKQQANLPLVRAKDEDAVIVREMPPKHFSWLQFVRTVAAFSAQGNTVSAAAAMGLNPWAGGVPGLDGLAVAALLGVDQLSNMHSGLRMEAVAIQFPWDP